jgi:hypothetical protein
VTEPLRIEAPTEDLAQALMSRLHAFPTELQVEDGRIEVRVPLVGDSDRAVVAALDGVDAWLLEHRLESVRVHLYNHAYTLTPRDRA